MSYLGVTAAARVMECSPYELLAQGVSGVLPLFRDRSGGCYFAADDLRVVPRRTVCAVRGCDRSRVVAALCLCSTHYSRWRKGADLSEPVKITLARRGPHQLTRCSTTLMRVPARPEQTVALDLIYQGGRVVTAAGLSHEDRSLDQLGTPALWQEIADAALERAWDDLVSGAYQSRLHARPAPLRATQRRAPIQSPLMVVSHG